MLNNPHYFNLINAANVASGLLDTHHVYKAEHFSKFKNIINGLPILIPADDVIFEFDSSDVFELDAVDICETIYGHNNLSYVGYRHAFKATKFISNFVVRKPYIRIFNEIVRQNHQSIRFVEHLKRVKNIIGAFQTRNIPHSGHEAIIVKMLDSCEHVVINPVIGPKKDGDVRLEALEKVFTNLATRKYGSKLSFMPVIANMFYAGPREAFHHAMMRERMGFSLFSIGRDHAGAENIYDKEDAIKLVNNYASHLSINLMLHQGAVYCRRCAKALVIGQCDCSPKYHQDIRGTDFRDCIKQRQMFPFADEEMQRFLHANKIEIFENG